MEIKIMFPELGEPLNWSSKYEAPNVGLPCGKVPIVVSHEGLTTQLLAWGGGGKNGPEDSGINYVPWRRFSGPKYDRYSPLVGSALTCKSIIEYTTIHNICNILTINQQHLVK